MPLLFLLLAANIQAQQLPQVDSLSVYILNRTVQTIQSLEACSFKVNTTYDVLDEDLGLVKHAGEEHVYMNFPDKAKIHFFGDKGRRVLWYNKTALVYYSFDKNQYSVIKTPDSIIKMMDVVSKEYGIEFPAADYFYDSFVDDLINTGGSLKYLGISSVNGNN